MFATLIFVVSSAASVTPYAGLRNQGNTCYMNSLLQSLCHVPGFASTVYQLDLPPPPPAPPKTATAGGASPAPSKERATGDKSGDSADNAAVAREVQRLLYQLGRAPSLGKAYASTERLTRALGMGPRDVLVQQDAQEFWQTLYAALSAIGREPRRKQV